MGLSILSEKSEERDAILNNIVLAAINSSLRLSIQENAVSSDGRIELEISKEYNTDEFLLIDIITEKEQIEQNHPDLLDISYQGQNYFMIAGTADADCEHLIYDFSLSYLKLKPNHIISVYDEVFIMSKGLKRIESNRGYYPNWMKEFTLSP